MLPNWPKKSYVDVYNDATKEIDKIEEEWNEGYNKCISDHQPLYDHIEKTEQRVKELETISEAWHTIFGTTQLTHASDRLNAAESKAEKLQKERDIYKKALEKIANSQGGWCSHNYIADEALKDGGKV